MRRASARTRFGYSLMEVLVVLALLALAASVVTPNFAGYLARAEERRTLARFETTLRALPFEARRTREAIRLDAPALAARADLPEDWGLTLEAPITARANGACADARLTLFPDETRRRTYRILAPTCALIEEDEAAAADGA